jgi:transposase-like protein
MRSAGMGRRPPRPILTRTDPIMNENWRPIPGRDGYEVSDLGRVRSVDRIGTRRLRDGRTVLANLKGRLLKRHVLGTGYLLVRLGQGQAYVHHLVLEAFVGPRPAGHQAAHGDGDRRNASLANLRWATPKENAADMLLHGTRLFGTRNPMGRKTHCQRGHPYNEENTRICKGKRYCKPCMRDHQRRSRGTHPSRFRTPIEPRLSEGLRLMAAGMSATQAAEIARVGRSTLARARRS